MCLEVETGILWRTEGDNGMGLLGGGFIYHDLFYFIGMQLSQKRDRIWRGGSMAPNAFEPLRHCSPGCCFRFQLPLLSRCPPERKKTPGGAQGRRRSRDVDFTLSPPLGTSCVQQFHISYAFTASHPILDLRPTRFVLRAQSIPATTATMAPGNKAGVANVHSHVSNRAKNKQALERKPAFKACLSNPFEIEWSVRPFHLVIRWFLTWQIGRLSRSMCRMPCSRVLSFPWKASPRTTPLRSLNATREKGGMAANRPVRTNAAKPLPATKTVRPTPSPRRSGHPLSRATRWIFKMRIKRLSVRRCHKSFPTSSWGSTKSPRD